MSIWKLHTFAPFYPIISPQRTFQEFITFNAMAAEAKCYKFNRKMFCDSW